MLSSHPNKNQWAKKYFGFEPLTCTAPTMENLNLKIIIIPKMFPLAGQLPCQHMFFNALKKYNIQPDNLFYLFIYFTKDSSNAQKYFNNISLQELD